MLTSLEIPPILTQHQSDSVDGQQTSPPPPPPLPPPTPTPTLTPLLPTPPPPTPAPVVPSPSTDEDLPRPQFSWNKAQFNKDMHFINTNFCPKLNKKVKYKTLDEEARYNYTQRARKATLNATPAHDVQQLRTLLGDQLFKGKRKNRESYIEVDTAILNGYALYPLMILFLAHFCVRESLCIRDKNGKHLVTILKRIPKDLIDNFHNTLRVSFIDFRDTDTVAEGINHTYPSAHGDVYGRYTNKVSLS